MTKLLHPHIKWGENKTTPKTKTTTKKHTHVGYLNQIYDNVDMNRRFEKYKSKNLINI